MALDKNEHSVQMRLRSPLIHINMRIEPVEWALKIGPDLDSVFQVIWGQREFNDIVNWTSHLFFAFFGGLGLLLLGVVVNGDGTGVDHLGAVLDEKLDLLHLVQLLDRTTGQ
jgi:aromatic ring-cleaving dioxygenase